MSTIITNRLFRISAALTGAVGLFGATNVFADANDDISNRATLQYSVGSATPIVIESNQTGNSTPGVGNGGDTVFKEDRVINFVVASSATGNVIPNTALQATAFTVTNNSNATLDFLLQGSNNADGTADPFSASLDEFDGTVIQTFVEDGTTVGFQAAEDTATFITGLAEGTNQIVYVVSTIPLNDTSDNPLVNGNVATMTLVAQAAENGGTGDGTSAIMNDNNDNASPGGAGFTNGAATLTTAVVAGTPDDPLAMDTVFFDPAGTQDGTGAADVIKNSQHSANSSYTIQSAELTVTKVSVALWDPVNLNVNPKSIPGAYVRYTITIANAVGAADADLTTLSDTLVAVLDLDPDFTNGSVGNVATSAAGESVQITHVDNLVTNFCTGAADADGCTFASPTLSVDINAVMGAVDAQLTAGESLTITFNVIVQ